MYFAVICIKCTATLYLDSPPTHSLENIYNISTSVDTEQCDRFTYNPNSNPNLLTNSLIFVEHSENIQQTVNQLIRCWNVTNTLDYPNKV